MSLLRGLEIAKIGLSENLTYLPSGIFANISRREKFPIYGIFQRYLWALINELIFVPPGCARGTVSCCVRMTWPGLPRRRRMHTTMTTTVTAIPSSTRTPMTTPTMVPILLIVVTVDDAELKTVQKLRKKYTFEPLSLCLHSNIPRYFLDFALMIWGK